jgi:hypothetical protein
MKYPPIPSTHSTLRSCQNGDRADTSARSAGVSASPSQRQPGCSTRQREPPAIPCDGTTLAGYPLRPDDTTTARPTLVDHVGYDPLLEEAYFVAAVAATRRGYNCIAFDGPGQCGRSGGLTS